VWKSKRGYEITGGGLKNSGEEGAAAPCAFLSLMFLLPPLFYLFFSIQFNYVLNYVNQPITQSECLNGATHGSAHILIGGIWHKSIADDSLVNRSNFALFFL